MNPVKYHWDEIKVGPGETPIKIPQRWLNIYHGVFPTMAGSLYRLRIVETMFFGTPVVAYNKGGGDDRTD